MNTYLLFDNNFELKIYNIFDKERKMIMIVSKKQNSFMNTPG